MRHYLAIVRSSDASAYRICVPDFPECEIVEDSLEKAVRSAGRALRLRIAGLHERGEPIPEARDAREIEADERWRAALADGMFASVPVPGDVRARAAETG